MFLIDYVFPTI